MSLRLDEQTMKDTLNVLVLSHPGSAEDLAKVNELNPACVKISSPEGPGDLDGRIAILSWRWDVCKLPTYTLDDLRDVISPKVVRFIHKARALGFKWAWCDYATVPQFAKDKDELMRHIQSSRTLYQRCSVIVIDVEEVYPGLSIPTMDFQTRLWIAAEKSAVLSNPNVNIADYVQISRVNHNTIALGMLGTWCNANYSIENYYDWFTKLKDPETREEKMSWLSNQNSLHILLYNIGYMYMHEHYPTVLRLMLSSFAAQLTDLRHTSQPPHLSVEEQEALINGYWTTEEGPLPHKPIRHPMRAEHPAVKALVKYADDHEKMPKNFSFYDHYPAILLLSSEVYHDHFSKHKFDPKIFEFLLVALGEHPTVSPPPAGAPFALTAFMRSDFVVVRDMMLDDKGRIKFPVIVDGVKFPEIPKQHEFHTAIDTESSFEELLLQAWNLCPIDAERYPETSANMILLSITAMNGGFYPSVDVTGAQGRVVLSMAGGQKNCQVIIWANPENPSNRFVQEKDKEPFHLGPEQVFLNFSFFAMGKKSTNQHRVSMFKVADGANTDTIRNLTTALSELINDVEDLCEHTPAGELEEKIREIISDSGITISDLP
eukprot:c8761_g1_i1.p1 GENE.c8761_g1_i1~~c8761_g1_i1.p1  ORF type:complete len:613 (+),score=151.86 c8761_g1_i1:35-1840(+)